jgi:hypothetical protein
MAAMTRLEKTRPLSVRLSPAEVEQLQARAYDLSATVGGVARALIRSGLAGGDPKALADRLMQMERRLAALEQLAQDTNAKTGSAEAAARDLLTMFDALLQALSRDEGAAG